MTTTKQFDCVTRLRQVNAAPAAAGQAALTSVSHPPSANTALGGLVHYPPQVETSTNEWRTIEHAMRARRPLRAPSLYMAQVRIIQKNRIWQTDLDAAHDPSPPSGYSSNFLATPLNAGDIVAFGLKP
jgi:hypothetical protein